MPRLMANANRKNFYNVDMQGNAQLYTLGIKPQSATKLNVIAYTAGNNYITRKAIKKWHDARKRMFRRLGFSLKDLGPYAATLRPYLSHAHHDGTVPEVATQTSIGTDVGKIVPVVPDHAEWTYSSAAVAVPAEEDLSSGANSSFRPANLVDTYQWTLLGTSVNEETEAESSDASDAEMDQDSWVTVGIIDSWLQSFKLKQQAIPSSTNDTAHEDNPLNQLWADSVSSEEVMEIVEDIQKENQPWDRTGATYYNSVTRSCWAIGDQPGYMVVEAPCGLLELDLVGYYTDGNTDDSTSHTSEGVEVEIEVLDIRDM
jgi:hypothetical protein